MTKYEEWFKNKFGFSPYDTTFGIREIDTLVAIRQDFIEHQLEIPELFKVATEEEYGVLSQNEKESSNETRTTI